MFVDKALTARMPEEGYPTDGPLALRRVDENAGYLIDPFAVEALFGMGRMPLAEKAGEFVPNTPLAASGYAALAPLPGFKVPEGVPVVRPDPAVQGFKEWLVTDAVPAMKDDPMEEPGELAGLMPKPGDTATIDGRTVAFRPAAPGEVAKQGGLLPPRQPTTLAFTVLEVPERRAYQLSAPFTPGTRQQVVLNGVPVRHLQVLEMEPGRYPLLVAVRMGIRWDRIGPWLTEATEEQIALGRGEQAQYEKRAAEAAKLKAAGWPLSPALIRKAADVPEAERRRCFWVADREQAEAWFGLHAVRGQSFRIP